MQSEPWFSNETKLGLGLASGALATLGIFALAVKFAPSNKHVRDVGDGASKFDAIRYHSDIPREGNGDIVPMKTMQVTLSLEVPQDFSKREIDALLARLKVVSDPSCKFLGVDAVGEPWGVMATRVR